MTLDIERLRVVCDSIKGQNPEDANPTTHAFYEVAWDLLPAAQKEIERLQSELERMAEMFAKDVYIESANLEPGHYDLRLKGKGCMLLAGQLTRMFYDSGGKNFITSTIEHEFSDGKDVFALTIQKMSGEDTPAQKLERQAKRIAELEAITNVEISDHNLAVIRSILHGDPHTREQRLRAFNLAGKVFRQMQKQRAALKKLGEAKRARGKALVEERAKHNHPWSFPTKISSSIDDAVLVRYQSDAMDAAREQLRQEGKL